MKTYKQFITLLDDSITPDEARQKYEEYKVILIMFLFLIMLKEKFKQQQARKFFHEHENEEWFKEKYHPELLAKDLIRRQGTNMLFL